MAPNIICDGKPEGDFCVHVVSYCKYFLGLHWLAEEYATARNQKLRQIGFLEHVLSNFSTTNRLLTMK